MIYIQTLLKIADNSGGYFALCLKVLSNSKVGRVGDAVIVSIKSIIANKKITHKKKRKVLKGSVRKAVIVRTARIVKRWGNVNLKGSSNCIAILGNWDLPVANRIKGPVFFELRTSKYLKTALLSEGVI